MANKPIHRVYDIHSFPSFLPDGKWVAMFQPKTRYIFSRKTKSSLTKSSESNQQLTKYKHYETRLMISVEWDVCLGKGDFLKL